MPNDLLIDRRSLFLGAIGLAAPWPATAAERISFKVFRNGAPIGEHQMTFSGDPANGGADAQVDLLVKVAGVTIFRYRHEASERWRGGRFASLRTSTLANGQQRRLLAEAAQGHVKVESHKGPASRPAGSAPLTHWNTAAFSGPMFHPEHGKLLKVQASRLAAGHWAIRGETQIDNFYDAAGRWLSLTGRGADGSKIEYRRL
ncbi:DUF6134 family protein [Phenylobacterium sp. J426]|uniref:DUF6134 family protein n=1 Tax=Phenylobacterium sp. J426 TaxID=2898439 RepID=UPI002151781B|nr:DUF6134 family protein [Phenylobacterium sp. J426]MCR5874882.1 DUF6134 family protein [Phenylobacterium sp. J426]